MPGERRMAGVQDRLGRMETGPASQAGPPRLRLLPWRGRPAVWRQENNSGSARTASPDPLVVLLTARERNPAEDHQDLVVGVSHVMC